MSVDLKTLSIDELISGLDEKRSSVIADCVLELGRRQQQIKDAFDKKLFQLLDHEDWEVRFGVVSAFGWSRNPTYINSLLERLKKEDHERVKWAIATAFMDYGLPDQAVISALEKLRFDEDEVIAERAQEVIEEIDP